MDFALSGDLENFRQEIREFIAEALPAELQREAHTNSAEQYPKVIEFRRRLGERGWIGLSWPKQYGG